MLVLLPKKQPGFTLIELMVTITIGALLTSLGLAAYQGVGKRQTVKQAGLGFETNLRVVQQKVLAGDKFDCQGTLESYRVEYKNETSYSAEAICGTSNSSEIDYNLIDGSQFNSVFEPIIFQVLKHGVEGQTIVIESSDGTVSYNVKIEPSGAITGELD